MPNRGQTIDVPELHLFHGTPYPTTKNDKTTVLIWSMDAWERPKALAPEVFLGFTIGVLSP